MIEHKKLRPPQAFRNPRRVQTRTKQTFIGVDVANAAQNLLVKKQRFDPGAPRSKVITKLFRADFERFFSHSALELAEGRFWHEKHPAKATDVCVSQLPAIIEVEKAMRVGRYVIGGTSQCELASHPEVNDEADA